MLERVEPLSRRRAEPVEEWWELDEILVDMLAARVARLTWAMPPV
jgi:hypothetical protein